MVSGNAIETAQMRLGLVPEILDAVDVIPAIGKPFRMVDPVVLEGRNIQNIVGGEGVGIDDRVGHDFLLHDGLQGGAFDVADHPGIDLAPAL